MGLFGRRSKSEQPDRWHDLWTVLAPFGGALTPLGLETWRRASESMTAKVVGRACGQLHQAYGLLNTESHARYASEPWTGVGHPFAFRRFLRVVDAVVLAGPDAVQRVAADPTQLRYYDTAPPLDQRAFYYELRPDQPPLWVAVRDLLDRVSPPGDRLSGYAAVPAPGLESGLGKRWPSVSRMSPRATLLQGDPSIPWLDFESGLDDLDDIGSPEGWETSGGYAADRIFVELGPRLSDIVPGLAGVTVDFCSPGDAPSAPERQDDQMLLTVVLSETEYAASTLAARVDVLTRRGAAALLELPLTETARETVRALTTSPGSAGR